MDPLFTIKIEKFALGGYGLGFHGDKAVFVPQTVPGDELEVRLQRERKDTAFASPIRFIRRGGGVHTVDCEAFAATNPCGGCDWLMLDYQAQLEAKTALIRELFHPLAPGLDIPGVVASPLQANYRNKTFMPVGPGDGGLSFGIFARWSHQIVPHRRCHLHPPLFDTIAQRCLELCQKAGVKPYDEVSHTGILRHLGIRANRDQSSVLLILVTRGAKLPFSNLIVKQITTEFPAICGVVQNINRERGNVILGPEEKLLYGNPWLFDDLAGLRFRMHYRSFWQVNPGTAELIIARIKSQLRGNEVLFDAYSGIGSLGLALAGNAEKVLCIEDCVEAAADGEVNAALNDIANVDYLCARVEDALPALLSPETGTPVRAPGAIILDPPRSGVNPAALKAIRDTRIPRVFYLSCAPMTLARDLKILLAEGAYRLESVQPFDMFPQTWHIETLAVLKRADDA